MADILSETAIEAIRQKRRRIHDDDEEVMLVLASHRALAANLSSFRDKLAASEARWTAAESRADALGERCAAIEAALTAIVDREACDMDHETGSEGASSSHRCGAEIARAAIAALVPLPVVGDEFVRRAMEETADAEREYGVDRPLPAATGAQAAEPTRDALAVAGEHLSSRRRRGGMAEPNEVTQTGLALIAEREKMLDLIRDLVAQGCTVNDAGEMSSHGLSAYEAGLRFLAARGLVDILSEAGGGLTARWRVRL